ncbi:MAG: hypothetical protein QOD53_2182 [Thermoleophilaceae bacterium]|nr:hypothetical protein [Thermoleophilaceae bacterium]
MKALKDRRWLDPDARSDERLHAHYEVERELADRLRFSSRDERTKLYREVYDELFQRVPDHPQLTAPADPAAHEARVTSQERIVDRFLKPDDSFLEIGAGDCALSLRVAERAAHVYAVEVAGAITPTGDTPENFELLLSDGCDIPVPAGSIDLAYSNQLMEHLHPDDAIEQVENIFRALAPGGSYICLTPHALLGPSDISAFFDDEPRGFHLREYTTTGLVRLFRKAGFRRVGVLAGGDARQATLPAARFVVLESLVRLLPRRLRRRPRVRRIIDPAGGVVATK